MSKNEKLYRDSVGETDNKWGSKEAIKIFDSRLCYEISVIIREGLS